MRKFSDQVKALLDSNPDINFCFAFKLTSNEELYLTNMQQQVQDGDVIYLPYSALQLHSAEFSDNAQDSIELRGLFDDLGIQQQHQLVDAQVKILAKIGTQQQLIPLFNWYCTNAAMYTLEFWVQLQPISVQFNRIFTEKYSPTCRTEFGDKRCKADKEAFSKVFDISEIQGNIIILKEAIDDDYYTYGEALLSSGTNNFHARIKKQTSNRIELDLAPTLAVQQCLQVTLVAGCDKKFTTCCNKFGNAINFRGEPFISELKDRQLKIHTAS